MATDYTQYLANRKLNIAEQKQRKHTESPRTGSFSRATKTSTTSKRSGRKKHFRKSWRNSA